MPRKRPPGAGARTRPAPTSSTRRSAESSRRRSVAGPATAPLEDRFARGLPAGLPVRPPTRERVQRALDGAGCPADELIALVPPNYGRATVEKIAVNAVMAGCRPEYFPVVVCAAGAGCGGGR